MSDVIDTVHDLNEKNAAFREAVEDTLTDFVGVEFEVSQVRYKPDDEYYLVYAEPVGISTELSDEFGAINVQTTGQIGFRFDISDLEEPDDSDDHPGQGRGPE